MMIIRLSTVSWYLILGVILFQSTLSCAQAVDVIDSSETALTEKNDGIESENFLPVANHLNVQPQTASEEKENISDEDEEGSGSDDDDNLIEPRVLALSHNIPDESEGSGDEPVSKEDEINDSSESTNATMPLIMPESAERDGKSYEITDATSAETTSNQPVQLTIEDTTASIPNEEIAQAKHILPNGQSANQSMPTTTIDSTAQPETKQVKPTDTNNTHSEVARINHPVKESQATYILLACLGVILVLLIFYLVYKRYRSTNKHTHYINDAENAPQEMLNMNRNNLGKPLRSSNDEQCIHIPLIPDNEKSNGLTSIEKPLLQHSSDEPLGNGLCEPEHENADAIPSTNGVHGGPYDNSVITTTAAVPHKSPRYSPVSST